MILKTSVKIYLFFCKIVITDSLTVYWGVLFELLLLEGFGSRDPTSAVKLVVMKWTEHSPAPPPFFPCADGVHDNPAHLPTSGFLTSKRDVLFLFFYADDALQRPTDNKRLVVALT